MKILYISVLFILSSVSVQAQFNPQIYVGIQGMYDKGFENNTYGAFEFGAEILKYRFLSPEVGLKYYVGSPNELETLNFDQNPPVGTAKFDSRFKSFVISLGPKISFGNEEAALVLLPEFNIGNIRTFKRSFIPDGRFYETDENIDDKQNISFWNFSAGIQGNFFDLDRIAFSVLVTYTTLDTKQVFNELQFENTTRNYSAGSKDGIGLTVRAYFDIFRN